MNLTKLIKEVESKERMQETIREISCLVKVYSYRDEKEVRLLTIAPQKIEKNLAQDSLIVTPNFPYPCDPLSKK